MKNDPNKSLAKRFTETLNAPLPHEPENGTILQRRFSASIGTKHTVTLKRENPNRLFVTRN
jgi:hypothetical protein